MALFPSLFMNFSRWQIWTKIRCEEGAIGLPGQPPESLENRSLALEQPQSGVAPANQTKERSVHELFAEAFRNKSSMWIVLVFPRRNTRKFTKKGEIHELFVSALCLLWFAGATPENRPEDKKHRVLPRLWLSWFFRSRWTGSLGNTFSAPKRCKRLRDCVLSGTMVDSQSLPSSTRTLPTDKNVGGINFL